MRCCYFIFFTIYLLVYHSRTRTVMCLYSFIALLMSYKIRKLFDTVNKIVDVESLVVP